MRDASRLRAPSQAPSTTTIPWTLCVWLPSLIRSSAWTSSCGCIILSSWSVNSAASSGSDMHTHTQHISLTTTLLRKPLSSNTASSNYLRKTSDHYDNSRFDGDASLLLGGLSVWGRKRLKPAMLIESRANPKTATRDLHCSNRARLQHARHQRVSLQTCKLDVGIGLASS